MLRLFEVSGYKNFDKKITLDFSDVRDYQFNTECINDGLLGKIIIYGKNGIGKSNFCKALFDVENHIRRSPPTEYDETYLNVNNENDFAEFRYVLQFDKQTLEYIYRKNAFEELIYEKVVIDETLLFEVDKRNPWLMRVDGLEELAPSLNKSFDDFELVELQSNTSRSGKTRSFYTESPEIEAVAELSVDDIVGWFDDPQQKDIVRFILASDVNTVSEKTTRTRVTKREIESHFKLDENRVRTLYKQMKKVIIMHYADLLAQIRFINREEASNHLSMLDWMIREKVENTEIVKNLLKKLA